MFNFTFPRIVLAGFALVTASFFFIERSGAEESGLVTCNPPNSCKIEYQYLATQQSDPFLYQGKLVNSAHPRWRQYKKFLLKFEDVRDCLADSEAQAEYPNVLLIDWMETGTGRGAQVCAFLIFRSIENLDEISQWLKLQHFEVGDVTNFRGEGFIPYYPNEPFSNLTALWNVDVYREVNPSMANTFFGLETVSSFQLVIYFNEVGIVVGVDTIANTKFN